MPLMRRRPPRAPSLAASRYPSLDAGVEWCCRVESATASDRTLYAVAPIDETQGMNDLNGPQLSGNLDDDIDAARFGPLQRAVLELVGGRFGGVDAALAQVHN